MVDRPCGTTTTLHNVPLKVQVSVGHPHTVSHHTTGCNLSGTGCGSGCGGGCSGGCGGSYGGSYGTGGCGGSYGYKKDEVADTKDTEEEMKDDTKDTEEEKRSVVGGGYGTGCGCGCGGGYGVGVGGYGGVSGGAYGTGAYGKKDEVADTKDTEEQGKDD